MTCEGRGGLWRRGLGSGRKKGKLYKTELERSEESVKARHEK